VCSRAMIIGHGRLLADGTPASLEARSRYHNAIRLVLANGEDQRIAMALQQLPDIASVEAEGEGAEQALIAFPRDGHPILEPVADLLRAHRCQPQTISVERGRLDDVFRQVTGTSLTH